MESNGMNMDSTSTSTPTPTPTSQIEILYDRRMESNSKNMNIVSTSTPTPTPEIEMMESNGAKRTCGYPLKRKKGHCKSKPGIDGLCARHRKQPAEDGSIQSGGKIVVRETMKTLHQIAKDEGLKGYSRKSKEALVKLIEEKTNRKFTREEVFSKKQLKTLAKSRGITKYSRLRREDLLRLVVC